jgi:hypothetical protein
VEVNLLQSPHEIHPDHRFGNPRGIGDGFENVLLVQK